MSTNNGYLPAYIPDGYTRPGRIAKAERLHEAVSFVFRPATAQESEIVMGRVRRESSDRQGSVFMAEVIKKHIIEWDVKDGKRTSLPIEVDKIVNLHPNVFSKLFSIIVGVLPSDAIDDGDSTDSSDAAISYEAELAGISKEHAEVKN